MFQLPKTDLHKIFDIPQGLDRSQKLYFDLETPILFYENASSGIRALADLYARLYTTMSHASFLYLDEFDAFYNYKLS